MMHMDQRMVQTQTQRLMLTQKMQQAIQILQYSGIELEQYVQQEMEANPVLEVVQQEPPKEARAESGAATPDGAVVDDTSFDLDDFASRWLERYKEGRDLSFNPDNEERRQYFEESITQTQSFAAMLMNQLSVAAPNERARAIGERLLGDIDNRGYFTGSLEEIAKEFETMPAEVERVLYLIQRFEPTGVGARDVTECLLLQINAEYPENVELKRLVEEHLTDLEHRLIPKIARAMNITPERVEELKELLATLNPWPGHEYAFDPPQYITPDVIVEKDDDDFVVYLSSDSVPQLRISGDYRQLAKGKHVDKADKKYIRERVESAKWLIRNIEQRQQTILRIATAIVEVQREFLDKGIKHIKPLTLQEIADRVGVHEATVSRTTRGKYIQTPQGLFELKYFFSPGLRKDGGDSQSSKSVQSMIKDIIEKEDKRKPLSDQKIADLLKDKGINIARRTVTKYREAMDLGSTTMRKEYGG
jgi:RNA polymerase sigma-54 factor